MDVPASLLLSWAAWLVACAALRAGPPLPAAEGLYIAFPLPATPPAAAAGLPLSEPPPPPLLRRLGSSAGGTRCRMVARYFRALSSPGSISVEEDTQSSANWWLHFAALWTETCDGLAAMLAAPMPDRGQVCWAVSALSLISR